MKNKEAFKYYSIAEATYRHLHPQGTNFMNLGLWPAKDLITAQENLVKAVLEKITSPTFQGTPRILELGSGWGASRRLVYEVLPSAIYTAVNCSLKQIEYAQLVNSEFANTNYQQGYFEELDSLFSPEDRFDAAFGIESLLHANDKPGVIASLRKRGVVRFCFAEICLEQVDIEQEPLFYPSLTHCFTRSQYEACFEKAGVNDIRIEDISSSVFDPWSHHLNSIESAGFSGNARVLRQFQESYRKLAELGRSGRAEYLIISGSFK